ncbi:antibiotic biosynthesis monooxygenase [Candidatus Amoebophilus asiaticus]|nr:antibiotic biosynthesis monooxygenase [Candidatus Amoebophilus asiaticus]
MIIRIVKMTFQKEKVHDFLNIFEQSKEKIKSFEGCKHLELHNDIEEGNVLFTYSIWNSVEALENYRKSRLFSDTWSKTKKLFIAKSMAWTVRKVG